VELHETFIYDPIIVPSTNEVIYHCWSFPNMLWSGSKLMSINKIDGEIKPKLIYGSNTIATCQPKLSPNGKTLAFLCDETGYYNLYITSTTEQKPQQLLKEDVEIGFVSFWVTGQASYCWLDDSNIVFTRNFHGSMKLAVINIENKIVRHLELPVGSYTNLQSLHNGKHFVCDFTNHNTNLTIVMINSSNYGFYPIFNSGIKMSNEIKSMFVEPEVIHYPTVNSITVHGLLYVAPDKNGNKKNAPVIILAHGGPTGMSSNRFQPLVQYFATRGWAVFAYNYRGSIGYGRKYLDYLNGNWGIVDSEDAIEGLKYLVTQGIVDPKKTAILGGSAGGFTTLNVLAKTNLFKAGVDFCGVSDLFLLNEETHLLERHYNDLVVGPLPQASDIYIERSPSTVAHLITSPLLILQGEKDTVVPKNQSEIICKRVKGPVEYYCYPNEGHMFMFKPNVMKDSLPRTQKFLTNYVLYGRKL